MSAHSFRLTVCFSTRSRFTEYPIPGLFGTRIVPVGLISTSGSIMSSAQELADTSPGKENPARPAIEPWTGALLRYSSLVGAPDAEERLLTYLRTVQAAGMKLM